MKTGIMALVLCAALLVPIVTTAGDPGNRPKHGDRAQKAHKLGKHLGLSEEQRAQMQAINKDTQAQRKALKDLPEADRKAAAQKLRADRKAKTDAVLTPEQRQKHDEMAAKHKAKKG